MSLPSSPTYTKKGHEELAEEVNSLLPKLVPLSDPKTKLTRWDGAVGDASELCTKCLGEIRQAANEPAGGDWINLGTYNGMERDYHKGRTEAGWGNRFFRFKAVVKVPPQLFAVSLLEPTILGNIDKTVRHLQILHNFPDGRTRLVNVVAEAGPRPIFYDRDECALSTYYPPELSGDNSWWQVSCTVPSHFPSVRSAVRNYTMYWGYKLEPFKDPQSGDTHTRLTLVSQTEIFGWLPKFLVNHMITGILPDYVRHLEEYLLDLLARGAPAKMLVESYGLKL